MAPAPSRCRRWCFTAKQVPVGWFDKLSAKYLLFGEETAPSTGHLHWQGYVELDKALTLGMIKMRLPVGDHGCHWEPARGSADQNKTYCKKDGKFVEQGESAVQGKRNDLLAVKEALDSGHPIMQVRDDFFTTFAKYPSFLKDYADSKAPRRSWVTKVIMLWGDTGTGKSRRAHHSGAVFLHFDKSGFLHGYNGEPVVCFDEFRPDQVTRQMWLTLTDRYPMTVNVKGGSINWAPTTIYFTSNDDPARWYMSDDGSEQHPAVTRRITEIHQMVMPTWEPPIEVPVVQEVAQAAVNPLCALRHAGFVARPQDDSLDLVALEELSDEELSEMFPALPSISPRPVLTRQPAQYQGGHSVHGGSSSSKADGLMPPPGAEALRDGSKKHAQVKPHGMENYQLTSYYARKNGPAPAPASTAREIRRPLVVDLCDDGDDEESAVDQGAQGDYSTLEALMAIADERGGETPDRGMLTSDEDTDVEYSDMSDYGKEEVIRKRCKYIDDEACEAGEDEDE